MSYKNILVHIDDVGANGAHIETALKLAEQHGAHLTGIHAITQPDIPAYVQAQISVDVIDLQVRQAQENAKEAMAEFEKQAASEGISTESVIVEGLPEEVLTAHARCADLLVIGQNDPDKEQFNGDGNLPDRLILAIGRPVLVVPYAGKYPSVGKNVYVAWDGSRQSTRALNDALPILQKADKVTVLSINPKNKGLASETGDVPGAAICLHLARHGVNAVADHVVSGEISGADTLLSLAADSGADLIVMGAYGHARWREVVLGGFTHHMLAHMTMPVLMAN